MKRASSYVSFLYVSMSLFFSIVILSANLHADDIYSLYPDYGTQEVIIDNSNSDLTILLESPGVKKSILPRSVKTVYLDSWTLNMNTYQLKSNDGGAGIFAEFILDEFGNIDYLDALDGTTLGGKGTTVLEILAYPVTIDAKDVDNLITAGQYSQYIAAIPRRGVKILNLVPNTLNGYALCSVPGDNMARFNVDEFGSVYYSQEFNGIISGLGSQQVTVVPHAITINSAQVDVFVSLGANTSPDTFFGWIPLRGSRTFSLAGNTQNPYYLYTCKNGYFASFTVTPSGAVQYSSGLDGGVVTGIGTNIITVTGHEITIDASEIDIDYGIGSISYIESFLGPFPPRTVSKVRLNANNQYALGVSSNVAGTFAQFNLNTSGLLTYDATLEGSVLTGAGTKALKINGHTVTINAESSTADIGLSQSVTTFEAFVGLTGAGSKRSYSLPANNQYDYKLYNGSQLIGSFKLLANGNPTASTFTFSGGTVAISVGDAPVSEEPVLGRTLIDASAVSTRIRIGATGYRFVAPGKAECFQLTQGTYAVISYPGSTLGNVTVDANGIVTYSSSLEGGVFTGSGTNTLSIVGHTVKLLAATPDCRARVGSMYYWAPAASSVTYSFPAGSYRINTLPGGDCGGFTVSASGTVAHAQSSDSALFTIVDQNRLELVLHPVMIDWSNTDVRGRVAYTNRFSVPGGTDEYLLPKGNYLAINVPGSYYNPAFTVGADGNVSYGSDLEGGTVTGIGTNTLSITGHPVTLDMSGTSVYGQIAYLESRTKYSGKRDFRLPRGTYTVGASTSWLKNFSVDDGGIISYDSQFEGAYFTGAGTSTVRVVGHEVQLSFTNPSTVGGLYLDPFISDDGTGALMYLPSGTYTLGSPQSNYTDNLKFIVNADGSVSYDDLILNSATGYDIGDVNTIGLDDQPFEKITITNPVNLSHFTEGAGITLSASVENCPEVPLKVEFFNGSVLLGEDTEAPYELQLTGVPKGKYNILAIASLPSGNSLINSVLFYVDGVNQKPVANAGADMNKNEGAAVALDGTGSNDPDNNEITFMWGQVAGPAVKLTGDDTATPSFTAPQVGPGGADVVLRLLVSDTTAVSEADTVTVHINDTNSRDDAPVIDEPVSTRTPYGITLWEMGRSVQFIDQFHQYLGNSLDSFLPAAAPETSKRILIEPEMIDVDKTCGWYRYSNFLASHNGDQGPTLEVPVVIPKKGLYRFWVRYGCKAGYAAATGITIYQEGNRQLGPVFTDRMYDSRASISGYDFKDFTVELQAGRYIIKFSHHSSLTENTYLSSRYLDYIYITDELWAEAPTAAMVQEIKANSPMNYIQWTFPHTLSDGEKTLWKKWQVRPLNWDDKDENSALFAQSLAFWRHKIDQLALAAHNDNNLSPERQIIFDDRWNMTGNPRRIAQRVTELAGSIDFNPSMTYEQYLEKAQNLGADTGKEYILWTPVDSFAPLSQDLWPSAMLPSGPTVIDRTVPREGYASQPIFIRSLRGQPAALNVAVTGGVPGSVSWRVIAFTNVGSSDASDAWVPFQLMNRPQVTVPALNVAGIWLTACTKGMAPGDYQYTVTLSGDGVSTTNVQLNLHVSRVSAVPETPYLVNPFTRPPEGEAYIRDFVDHGLNVWRVDFRDQMTKEEMVNYGIRQMYHLQQDARALNIQLYVDKMRQLGYSPSDWVVKIHDEPWQTTEEGLADYIEIANLFRLNEPDINIAFNPGGYASAATYEALDPYADFWIPYASHLNNAEMTSIFTQKPWSWYTTYVYYDKSPAASNTIYQQMRSIPAKPANCVGTAFMAHYYQFSFNNAWDTAFEGWTDSALMLLPTRHGPVAAMPYEALREGIQHAHVAKQLKEHPEFIADEAGLELIANGSLPDLLTTLESKMNIPPVASAGPDQTVHIGSVVTLDGSGSSDPDEKYPLSYAWTITEKPEGSAAALANAGSASPSFTVDLPGTYTVRIIVTDATGVASEPAFVHVSTTNTAPTADAGADLAATEMGAAVQLDGSKSWDPDGDAVFYSWTIVQKPDGSNAALVNSTSATPSLVPDIYGEYRIQLVASDPWISGAPDEVIVSFTNIAPVAVPGNNKSCIVNDIVLLDGSRSYDANGDTLTYRWQIVSAPAGSAAALTDADTAMAGIQPDLPGEYLISLTVNDGAATSAPGTVSVAAISYDNAAVQLLQQAISLIDALPESYFKNRNMSRTLTKKINVILVKIDEAEYEGARNQLVNDVLQKMDGYINYGTADSNDWIVDWASQEEAYQLVMDAADLLENFLVL